ncbi:hypothetical protein ACWEN6_13600 [Sphaerisporangium sp. NPDC004334]
MARLGRGFPAHTVITRPLSEDSTQSLGGTGQAEQARSITPAKSAPTGQVAQSATARPVTAVKVGIVGQVIEVVSVAPVTPVKSAVVGQVVQSDTAVTGAPVKSWRVGQVTEGGAALAITIRAYVAHLVETGQALPITPVKVRTVPPVVDTATARPATPARGRVVGQAVEVGAAPLFTRVKARLLVHATEAARALLIAPPHGPLSVGQPFTTWSASSPYIAWSAGPPRTEIGGAVDPISSLSKIAVRFFVSGASGAEPVEIAFTVPDGEPTESDWHTAEWDNPTQRGAEALIIVGPGGAVPLPDGTWLGWVRVTTPRERPVIPGGLVPIT